jgi:rRNA maturation RNase YbeY
MPQRKSRVFFHFEKPFPPMRDRIKLRLFIEKILMDNKKAIFRLDYVFCSDSYLLNINRKFLCHDYFTDIISFDLSEGQELLGEIYISIDRVRENSKEYETSVKNEIHRVVFHGALHLCGYKDKKMADKLEMSRLEDYYLKRYFK